MRSVLVLAGVLLLTTAAAASAAPRVAPLRGVVVGSQHGVLLVASPRGVVRAVRGQDAVGMRVSVSGARITNLGHSARAVVRGVLVRRQGSLSFLSAAGHILVVHAPRRLASAADNTPTTEPQPGSVVQDTVSFGSQGQLDEQDEEQVGDASQAQVTAVVSAVSAGTVTVSINGQALTIPLPAGLTLPASIVGSQVTFDLSFAGGAATVEGEQGDEGDVGSLGSDPSGFQLGGTGSQDSWGWDFGSHQGD